MPDPALAPNKARLTLSSADAIEHDGKITSCIGVVTNILSGYATDNIGAKADE